MTCPDGAIYEGEDAIERAWNRDKRDASRLFYLRTLMIFMADKSSPAAQLRLDIDLLRVQKDIEEELE